MTNEDIERYFAFINAAVGGPWYVTGDGRTIINHGGWIAGFAYEDDAYFTAVAREGWPKALIALKDALARTKSVEAELEQLDRDYIILCKESNDVIKELTKERKRNDFLACAVKAGPPPTTILATRSGHVPTSKDILKRQEQSNPAVHDQLKDECKDWSDTAEEALEHNAMRARRIAELETQLAEQKEINENLRKSVWLRDKAIDDLANERDNARDVSLAVVSWFKNNWWKLQTIGLAGESTVTLLQMANNIMDL